MIKTKQGNLNYIGTMTGVCYYNGKLYAPFVEGMKEVYNEHHRISGKVLCSETQFKKLTGVVKIN